MIARILALSACLAVTACGPQSDDPSPAPSPAAVVAMDQARAPASSSAPPTLQPPPAPPREPNAPIPPAPPAPPPAPPVLADKVETGARGVLLTWARALEVGNYDLAFAQWGAAAEARSGMSRAAHAAYWGKFKTITVAMPTGTLEGAAGSLYYEAPTTVIGKRRADGKPYRLLGTVTLRRVNDVDGATADQLRWHIEKVDLTPSN